MDATAVGQVVRLKLLITAAAARSARPGSQRELRSFPLLEAR